MPCLKSKCLEVWAKKAIAVQFAATACTIVSGAIAERAKFEAYILYSFFMAAWVYPVLTHSIWSTSGWAGMFRYGLKAAQQAVKFYLMVNTRSMHACARHPLLHATTMPRGP